MSEEYITFAQASALTELGFPISWYDCQFYYTTDGQLKDVGDYVGNNIEDITYYQRNAVPCVTQSLVQKWLREEKNIYINVFHTFVNGCRYEPPTTYAGEITYRNPKTKQFVERCLGTPDVIYFDYKTYESALSACIDESIKIIFEQLN